MNNWFSINIPIIASQIVDFLSSEPMIYFVGLWLYLWVIGVFRDFLRIGNSFGSF